MSSGGTSTKLHYDPDHNMHCLVSGRKDFILYDREHADVFDFEVSRLCLYFKVELTYWRKPAPKYIAYHSISLDILDSKATNREDPAFSQIHCVSNTAWCRYVSVFWGFAICFVCWRMHRCRCRGFYLCRPISNVCEISLPLTISILRKASTVRISRCPGFSFNNYGQPNYR